jgi:hypothetical protein
MTKCALLASSGAISGIDQQPITGIVAERPISEHD